MEKKVSLNYFVVLVFLTVVIPLTAKVSYSDSITAEDRDKTQNQIFQNLETALANEDFETALNGFTALAEQGDAKAQYYLGLMHHKGYGTERNFKLAVFWYEKAAEQGLADAQHGAAVMYYAGKFGLKSDFDKAAHWVKKAAEQHHAKAQFDLGTFYDRGKGVSKDSTQAYKWIYISIHTSPNDKETPYRKRYLKLLSKRLSEDQIKQAVLHADSWLNKSER